MAISYRSNFVEINGIKNYIPRKNSLTKPLDGISYLAQSAGSEERPP